MVDAASVGLRLRDFLSFLRPRLAHLQTDTSRTVQMRRIADLRITERAVKKPAVTAEDVGRTLSADGSRKTFVEVAIEEKLLGPESARVPLGPQSEEMGYCIELTLLSQILPEAPLRGYLREFVQEHPIAGPPPPPSAEIPGATAPLPEKIRKLLGDVKELWAIPQTTLTLLRKLGEPEPKVDEIARDIRRDPGMTAQVLRIANSAYYALPRKISSIHRAVMILGFQAMKRIVTIASLVTKLGREHDEVRFDLKDFWGHSLWVACAAQGVARLTEIGDPEEHFSSGLLHDIGKLVEYQYLRHAMREILAGVARGGRYDEMEKIVLGVDHAAIGACVCERWDLPPALAEASALHLRSRSDLERSARSRVSGVVGGLCALSRRSVASPERDAWCTFLRVTAEQLEDVRKEATAASIGSLRAAFLTM